MVKYLQLNKPEVKKLKESNIIYIIPMLNPDGVALGMTKCTGPNGVNISYSVGTDDPSSRTLINFVDKIIPELWIDIHSWMYYNEDGLWATHQWVADGITSKLPDKTFQGMDWKVSLLSERKQKNHLWQYLKSKYDSGGASLSFTWYRRSEKDMRKIGIYLINAFVEILSEKNN